MLKKIVKGIGKALFGMHLWLPLSYSFVFLAIAAIADVLAGSWPFYFVGLSVSLAASLALVYYSSLKAPAAPKQKTVTAHTEETLPPENKRKDEELKPFPVSAKKETKSVTPGSAARQEEYERFEDEAARIYEEQVRYSQQMTAQPNNVAGERLAPLAANEIYAKPAEPYVKPGESLLKTDAMRQYYGETPTQQQAHATLYSSFSDSSSADPLDKPSFSPYVQPGNVDQTNSARLGDYDADKRPHNEEPKIFRTRREPNVLMYEYSDCYEKYYLNPDGSLTYLCTEKKMK